jgi:FKBP-type peptidyl-prolyl cis-trans isomerase FkpA
MNKLSNSQWVAIGVVVCVMLVLIFYTPLFRTAPNPVDSLVTDSMPQGTMQDTTQPAGSGGMMSGPQGLQMNDVVVGTGAEAAAGKTVTVNYTGTFADGTVFDSSVPRGQPFVFVLGQGRVIKGWDEGLVGMKVGGKRTLVIPADMAYGAQGIRDPATGQYVIPPESVLYFDVELVNVQ